MPKSKATLQREKRDAAKAESDARAPSLQWHGGMAGNAAPLFDPELSEAAFKELQQRAATQNITTDMEERMIRQHSDVVRATRGRRMAARALVAVSSEITKRARASYKATRRLESSAVLMARLFKHFHAKTTTGKATETERNFARLLAVHLERETQELTQVAAMRTHLRALQQATHEAVNLNRNMCRQMVASNKMALAVPAYRGPAVGVTAMPHRAGDAEIVRRRKSATRKKK